MYKDGMPVMTASGEEDEEINYVCTARKDVLRLLPPSQWPTSDFLSHTYIL